MLPGKGLKQHRLGTRSSRPPDMKWLLYCVEDERILVKSGLHCASVAMNVPSILLYRWNELVDETTRVLEATNCRPPNVGKAVFLWAVHHNVAMKVDCLFFVLQTNSICAEGAL